MPKPIGLSKLPDRFTTDSRPIDPQTVREAAAAPQETFAELLKPAAEVTPGTDTSKLYNLAMAWAASDPPTVAEWLDRASGGGRFHHTATGHVGLAVSQHAGLPLGAAWTRSGATAWVASLPDGPLKARAWGAMYDRVESYSPDLAFEHSAALLQGGSRLPCSSPVCSPSAKKSAKGPQTELLQSPDLTAEERASLTAALQRPRPTKTRTTPTPP